MPTTAAQALIGEIVALLIGYPSVEDPDARERIIDQIVRRAKEAEAMVAGTPLETPAAAHTAGYAAAEPHRGKPEQR